ncbi:MAG TPA: DsbA family protein [Paracoccaceae bacterium]|nr:DsbA family protein [Paracoccaceae bacterium]
MRFTPIRDAIPGIAAFILAGLLMASPLALATAETEADPASAPAEISEAAPESAEPAASGAEDSAGEAATEAEAESAAETGNAAAEGEVEAVAEDSGYLLGDVVLGEADAPVTVVEYASFTCPHCGTFAKETFPQVRKDYVETGKVKFILREVYFDQYGLWASMVARCGGEKGFYPLAHRFLTTQENWTGADDIGLAIHQIGRRAGLSADRLEQCLSDREFATELLADYQRHAAEDEIQSTPTFIINGKKHGGAMSYEEFSKLLDAEL